MSAEPLNTATECTIKTDIREALWTVADRFEFIRSVTLTGSFVEAESLEGISDIDCVVVVDHLTATRFEQLVQAFDYGLRSILAQHGFDFLVNPTLGPLKFNAPKLAVLHLMLYSEAARVRHARQSPFTCFDWQRSTTNHKQSLIETYPVFGLMPRHFLGGRRSVSDYLKDVNDGVISYRELICDETGYSEKKLGKPMTIRDRHEFTYHVMKFLMNNLLKLLTRQNIARDTDGLIAGYFTEFPDGRERFGPFFRTLAAKKKAIDFTEPLPDLLDTLGSFATAFETQFRTVFFQTATRHTVVRHAPTALNSGIDDARKFQGRIDVPALPVDTNLLTALAATVDELKPQAVFSSPALRALQTLRGVGLEPIVDARLWEIDYGQLDGLTIAEAKTRFPEVFTAWSRNEDPRLPNGESLADVRDRIEAFADSVWTTAPTNTITCTHNVVMRCLIGDTLGVPRNQQFRLTVPHLSPITFVQTTRYGRFVDIPEEVEPLLFATWEPKPTKLAEAA